MAEKITKTQALHAVCARLPILGDKKLQQQLEYAAGSLSDAYRIGAEEAQHVIRVRIEQKFERAAARKEAPRG